MEYRITGHTRMGCLLGSPIAHSLSPSMYNDSFQALGIDQCYLCFEILPEQLGETVETLRRMDVFGFNLTMPDKTAVIPYLDELSVEAGLIGAVNTVKNEAGRLVGYNTDGMGYMKSVREAGCEVKGKEMVLLGAGGAAGAVAVQAALDGVSRLHLVSRRGRSWEHAGALVKRISEETNCAADLTDLQDTEAVQALAQRSVLLTNATSVGMSPNEDASPLPETFVFPPDMLVSDIIYNPRETKLMRQASAQGCRVMNGLYMLLYQGEAAFRIWTGQQMPVELIRTRYFRL